MLDRVGELYPKLDATELRKPFLEEMPQVPTEGTIKAETDVDEEDALTDAAVGQ